MSDLEDGEDRCPECGRDRAEMTTLVAPPLVRARRLVPEGVNPGGWDLVTTLDLPTCPHQPFREVLVTICGGVIAGEEAEVEVQDVTPGPWRPLRPRPEPEPEGQR